METRGSIRLHYGADPQLRAPDSGLRPTGRGALEQREGAALVPVRLWQAVSETSESVPTCL